MGNSKVLTDFSSGEYTDLELSNKASNISTEMTGNAKFPAPVKELDAMNVANAAFKASLDKIENGTKEDTAIKKVNRASLEKALRILALYVQVTSDGDEAIILSSGFDVNSKHEPIGKLPKPEGFGVKVDVAPGTVIVFCNVIPGASFYEIEYSEVTADGVRKWIKVTSTKRKLEIAGLISGKQYVFRMAGAGSNPARMWSDEIITFVI